MNLETWVEMESPVYLELGYVQHLKSLKWSKGCFWHFFIAGFCSVFQGLSGPLGAVGAEGKQGPMVGVSGSGLIEALFSILHHVLRFSFASLLGSGRRRRKTGFGRFHWRQRSRWATGTSRTKGSDSQCQFSVSSVDSS